MSIKLPEKMTLLAEKVGYEVVKVSRQIVDWDGLSYINEEIGPEYLELPGGEGTLTEVETTVVLDWLDKVGYKTVDHKDGLAIQEFKPHRFGSGGKYRTVAVGESLVKAMLVLPLSAPGE